jgi:SAM-dependent methyltransferase
MRVSFHLIAYRALDVCNALEMATVEAAVARADLPAGATALDIGCGNGAVAALLARRFGLNVTAVERDPAMAALARERTAGSGVTVVETGSETALADLAPQDLIVVIGATEAAAAGLRDPQAVFERLRGHLTPGGRLLWGDLFWRGEPPQPLRMLVEAANTYLTHDGWQTAARAAGFEIVSADISSSETWDRYTAAMDTAAQAWLAAHPDAPEAPGVRASAQRVKAMFDFGRPYIGFGLYLLKAG